MSSRYYFHLANGDEVIRDLDGIELPDIHAALVFAMRTIAELRAEDPSSAAEWQDWRLEITDRLGQIVQVIPLGDPHWTLPSQHQVRVRPSVFSSQMLRSSIITRLESGHAAQHLPNLVFYPSCSRAYS